MAVREWLGNRTAWMVEANIRGFFDNLDHDWLMRMLEQRVADRPFLNLIRKWLNAGILETDGKVVSPVSGTPQGGIISLVLANIYLHYVLDLWFEKVFRKDCEEARRFSEPGAGILHAGIFGGGGGQPPSLRYLGHGPRKMGPSGQGFGSIFWRRGEEIAMSNKINEEWHRKNPMPKNASIEVRSVWHKVHAKVCGCREIPKTVVEYLKKTKTT